MIENIIYLLVGSGLGFVSSLMTIWFQNRLEVKQEHERQVRENQQKMVEDVHKFMETNEYRLLKALKYDSIETIELCKFNVEEGPDQGNTFSVMKNAVIIGQSNNHCDYVLSDPGVADVHLRLIIADEAYVLEDLSEGLGTRVNSTLMISPLVIRSNDLVQIGDTLLRFTETK